MEDVINAEMVSLCRPTPGPRALTPPFRQRKQACVKSLLCPRVVPFNPHEEHLSQGRRPRAGVRGMPNVASAAVSNRNEVLLGLKDYATFFSQNSKREMTEGRKEGKERERQGGREGEI